MIDNGDDAMTLWALLLAVVGVWVSVSVGTFFGSSEAVFGPLAGLVP